MGQINLPSKRSIVAEVTKRGKQDGEARGRGRKARESELDEETINEVLDGVEAAATAAGDTVIWGN